jgi:predicted lipoprotein
MVKKISVFILLVFIFSCSSDDNSNSSTGDDFDRASLLTNWADNIIIPAHQDFSGKLNALNSSAQTFNTTPNQTNLDALRSSWLNAYKVWQHVEMFNIGKAEVLNYYFALNTYPVNASEIESNISSGNYDLAQVNSLDAQGFAGIDYLLYGIATTDAVVIEKYSIDANAASYKQYLTDLIARMQDLTQQVINDWTGTYRDTFVTSDGNTATSSLNKLVNDFIFYYEKGLRANKVGIPAGIFSSSSLPDRVEGYYNQEVSKLLVEEALDAVQNFFNGTHYDASSTGASLKSYLDYLNTIKDGDDLSVLITNQFNAAEAQLGQLNSNFVTQINTDNTKMTQAYDQLQLAVVMLKVDMLQAFNVSVDYVDADGD